MTHDFQSPESGKDIGPALVQGMEELARQMEALRSAVGSLAGPIKQIPVVMEQLSEVVQVNQHQIQELDRHLKAFEQVRDKAVDALPEIGKRMDELQRRMEDSVNTQMSFFDEAMQREIERVMNEMGRALARISGQFTSDYAKLVKAMDRVVRQGGRA
jgi:chromosome segregation ATPase